MICHRCNRPVDGEKVGVRDVCPHCTAWLHCCRNCEMYAPGAHADCREPNAQVVADKEQGNFCDWFRPASRAAAAPSADPAADARARLDQLFRKK
jgi:hypothetical protein